MSDLATKLKQGQNLSFEDSKSLFSDLMEGKHAENQIIEILEALIKKGETKDELAGGIGYFTSYGEFDTCIALRTALIKNKKFYVQAGAGVVADSKPEKEYAETVNKAKALMRAVD